MSLYTKQTLTSLIHNISSCHTLIIEYQYLTSRKTKTRMWTRNSIRWNLKLCIDVLQVFAVVFRSMTIMLVAVSSYSLVTTIPRLIAVGLNNVNAKIFYYDQYWFYFWGVFIIAPWNYCGNFFMYVLSGKEFREELSLMFCCHEKPPGAFVYITLHSWFIWHTASWKNYALQSPKNRE